MTSSSRGSGRVFACGAQYYGKGKCYVLDTDAAPAVQFDRSPMVSETVRSQLGQYFDNPQFSDIRFLFPHENRTIHAHKVLLSTFSEHFRSMFSNAWREATQSEV